MKKGALLRNSAHRPANRSKNVLVLCSLALATPLPSLTLCRSFVFGVLGRVCPQGSGLPKSATQETIDEAGTGPIDRSAWKGNSANLALTELYEVRLTAYWGTTATASISTKNSG